MEERLRLAEVIAALSMAADPGRVLRDARWPGTSATPMRVIEVEVRPAAYGDWNTNGAVEHP